MAAPALLRVTIRSHTVTTRITLCIRAITKSGEYDGELPSRAITRTGKIGGESVSHAEIGVVLRYRAMLESCYDEHREPQLPRLCGRILPHTLG